MDINVNTGIDASAYKVMILDDIPVNTRLLEKILEREGFQLSIFNNSTIALDSIYDVNPDVILLDIMMPGIDGLTFLQRIRENHDYDKCRIIMISAVSESEEILKASQLGANDYITKPINPKRLVASVFNQIRQIKK